MKKRRVIRGFGSKTAEQLHDAMRSVVAEMGWKVHFRQSAGSERFSCDVMLKGKLYGVEATVFLYVTGILCEHEIRRLEISVHSCGVEEQLVHESEKAPPDGAELSVNRFFAELKSSLGCGGSSV
ncbi:MAG: hypothetical protein HGA31_06305 [Candidatus Moranbacteria bacterium]|nr:hypothetical protein [Candidatus Moranbacteria bacterium]